MTSMGLTQAHPNYVDCNFAKAMHLWIFAVVGWLKKNIFKEAEKKKLEI